jgi:methyl-accepting chemotaxis protein
VVAEEVGNLAAMSGSAALEITNMLEGSIKTVEGIVRDSKIKMSQLISTGKEKVETGTRIALDCQEVLNEIVSSSSSVSKMVTEISSASQEQAQGVHEITKAIAQLDQVTQQNTSNSAESANAASMLSNQADMLNSLVQQLVQTIEGGKELVVKKAAEIKTVTP